jgi:hypothetical protein
MPTRITAARIDLAGDESHGAWASGQHGESTWTPLVCWSWRAQGRELVDVAVSPASARARRRRRGGGASVGEHGVCDRFTRTREGQQRVAGRVRGDQGRGVLLHPQLTMRLKVSGHGEATAARFGLITAAASYARERGAKARPGRPGIATRARWGARQRGHWVGGVRAQAEM